MLNLWESKTLTLNSSNINSLNSVGTTPKMVWIGALASPLSRIPSMAVNGLMGAISLIIISSLRLKTIKMMLVVKLSTTGLRLQRSQSSRIHTPLVLTWRGTRQITTLLKADTTNSNNNPQRRGTTTRWSTNNSERQIPLSRETLSLYLHRVLSEWWAKIMMSTRISHLGLSKDWELSKLTRLPRSIETMGIMWLVLRTSIQTALWRDIPMFISWPLLLANRPSKPRIQA